MHALCGCVVGVCLVRSDRTALTVWAYGCVGVCMRCVNMLLVYVLFAMTGRYTAGT